MHQPLPSQSTSSKQHAAAIIQAASTATFWQGLPGEGSSLQGMALPGAVCFSRTSITVSAASLCAFLEAYTRAAALDATQMRRRR